MKHIDIKKIIIVIVIIIIGIGCYFYINNFSNNNTNIASNTAYNIVLFGPSEITLYKGEEYSEIGYYATNNNEIVTGEVVVTNNIDSNKEGLYIVKYQLGNVIKFRNVKVVDNPNTNVEDITLELIGNEVVNLNVGDSYTDAGCLAYDKDNNNISNRIIIDNQVNTEIVGIYYVTYTIRENDIEKSIKRVVNVNKKDTVKNDLNIDVNYDTSYTNKDLEVKIVASGEDFAYIKVPNGNQIAVLETTYTIKENGSYYFYVYDTEGNYKVQNVVINNIDKTLPIAYCKAKRSANKTEVQVTASDNIGIQNYVYYTNSSKLTSNSPNYTIPERLNTVRVLVTDKAGNENNITCEVNSGTIEMHFIAGVSDDDAILIRTDDKVIMIDGGRYEAKDKVISYLKDLGVKKIDAMIGSHVHWNHVQAQAAILDNFEVSELYYSVDILNCVSKKHCVSRDVKYIKDKIIEKGKTPKIIGIKDYLEIGDMKLYFIGPTRGVFTTFENANSLVFILEFGNKKYLFTGDTPGNYMNVAKFQANANTFGITLDVDVLKWPHHGYETLSDDIFKATTPEYAIIPNCCSCSSKYPSSTNKSLMKKYNTKYYQVCDSKNIVLLSDGNNIEIRTNQKAKDYSR